MRNLQSIQSIWQIGITCVVCFVYLCSEVVFARGQTYGTKTFGSAHVQRFWVQCQFFGRTEFVEKVERQRRPRAFLKLFVGDVDEIFFEFYVVVGTDEGRIEDGHVLLGTLNALQQLRRRLLAEVLYGRRNRMRTQIVHRAPVFYLHRLDYPAKNTDTPI